MLSRRAGFLAATLWLLSAVRATEAAPMCGSFQEPQRYQNETIQQASPVVFGEKHTVPALRIRFINGATHLPLQVQSIKINYGWKWWLYPYPEHAWGVWEDAADGLECHPDDEGWIDAPAHQVRPRGWYVGKYTRWPWNKRPYFDDVEVVVSTGYSARTHLRPADLNKFHNKDLVITVFDDWRTQSGWQTRVTTKTRHLSLSTGYDCAEVTPGETNTEINSRPQCHEN